MLVITASLLVDGFRINETKEKKEGKKQISAFHPLIF